MAQLIKRSELIMTHCAVYAGTEQVPQALLGCITHRETLCMQVLSRTRPRGSSVPSDAQGMGAPRSTRTYVDTTRHAIVSCPVWIRFSHAPCATCTAQDAAFSGREERKMVASRIIRTALSKEVSTGRVPATRCYLPRSAAQTLHHLHLALAERRQDRREAHFHGIADAL